jgi:hypothetical protein
VTDGNQRIADLLTAVFRVPTDRPEADGTWSGTPLPAWLHRRARAAGAIRSAGVSLRDRYGDADTLAQRVHWDEATRHVILDRVHYRRARPRRIWLTEERVDIT